ncbi:MAG: dual specificity protein phosphatase family protein [Polyangiaceae bacterium]
MYSSDDRDAPETPRPPCLTLERFGFAFGDRTILRSLDLAVPGRGMFTLLGPVSAGKSSLLRLLAGEMRSHRSCHVWGAATYLGAPLGEHRPALAGQRARLVVGTVVESVTFALKSRQRLTGSEQRDLASHLFQSLGLSSLSERLDVPVVELSSTEQRCLSLVSAFATGAALMCADEPTAGLPDADRSRVIRLLRRMAEERAVLFVTHHLGDVREAGGEMALLAGGVLQESAPVAVFVERPTSAAGQQFVQTGSCAVPSPDAVAEEIDPSISLAEAEGATLAGPVLPATEPVRAGPLRAPIRDLSMATTMKWVLPDKLAGIARPGLLRDLEDDLAALSSARIEVLVCLEETQTVPLEALHRHGIEPVWMPVRDMDAPGAAETTSLCERIHEALAANRRVAVHCKGGLGRTGTLLAAYLIWRGAAKPEALSTIRRIEPRFVQSTAQLAFLRAYWSVCSPGAAAAPTSA